MSAHTPLPRSARTRAPRDAVATVVAVLAALLAVVALSSPVSAANNPGITVNIAELQKADANGNVSDGFVRVGEVVRMNLTWDATGVVLAEGDSFTIELGSSLEAREPRSFPLTLNNAGGVPLANCDVTKPAITCTFTAEITRLQDEEGISNFKGDFWTLLMATAEESGETTTMMVNGTPTAVDLPGTGGIRAPRVPTYVPTTFFKVATPINAATTIMPWSVGFGTEHLEGRVPGFVADGVTTSTLVITENLGAGQTFVETPSSWNLVRASSSTSTTRVSLVNAAGRVYDAAGQDFTYTVSFNADKTVATMTITGVFQPETNYTVNVPSRINAGTAQEGVVYRNSVSIDGTDLTTAAQRYYSVNSGGSISMAPGFGNVEVTKVIDGEALDSVPAGTSFDVVVDYTLPRDASTYDGWTAPGTLNADGRTGTTTLTVTVGRGVQSDAFPMNTSLTLREDPTTASMADAATVVWGTPVFRVGNQTSDSTVTLTVGASTRAVSLSNTVSYGGILAVSKTVTGLADDVTAPRYAFDYVCGTMTGTIENVPGDGTVVPATPPQGIPEGTTCTVTERTDAAAVDGYDLTLPEPVEVTLARSTAGPTVAEFTNSYTPAVVPTPEPTVTPTATEQSTADDTASASDSASSEPGTPEGTLARTGVSVLVPVLGALAALSAGGILVRKRRQ